MDLSTLEQLEKQLGIWGAGCAPSQSRVMEHVQALVMQSARQRTAWDVCKLLSQQSTFESLVDTSISGIAANFGMGKAKISLFLVSPLDNQLIDVASDEGQAAFQQATESYSRMLDDAGTTDIRDDGVMMDEAAEFDHEERPASPDQATGTARAQEESNPYDHLRLVQSAESTPMASNLSLNNVAVPAETEGAGTGGLTLVDLPSENAPSKSLARSRSDSMNQRHAREAFASGNRNAAMKSSRSMQRTLVYHDIKTEAQTVTNAVSAVPAARPTPVAASTDGRTWSFMSKASPGRQQPESAKQNIEPAMLPPAYTPTKVEEARPWTIDNVDECISCTLQSEHIGMPEAELRRSLVLDTMQKRSAMLVRSKLIAKPTVSSTGLAVKRPTTPMLPALRRISKHEPASNSASSSAVSPKAGSAARRVSATTTVLSPNIAVATEALPQMGRLPRVSVSAANGPSAATAALQATGKGSLVSPLLAIRQPLSDGSEVNHTLTSSGSTHPGSQSGRQLSSIDSFPPALSPITRGGSETYSVAEHVDIDAPNIDFSGHASPRAASTNTALVEPSIWLSVPIPALDGTDAVPVGAIVVSVATGAAYLDSSDRRVFDMIATGFAQTKRRIRQMQAAHTAQVRAFGLVEMVKAVSHEVETPEIISRIISVAYDLLQAERVSVFFVDHEKRELLLALSEDAAGFRLPISKGLVGTVAVSGQVLNIPDAYKHPAFDRSFDSKTGFVTRSVLAMPVKSPAGDVVAVIQALNKRNGGVFLDEDVRTLSVVADTAGVTLHKATLLQDAKVAKEASAALADVVRIANDVAKEDVESLTVKLVAVGYRLINAERITLFLVDELRNELYCQVSQDVEGLRTIRIPIGQGIAGSVASSGSPVNIANAYEDARFDRSVDDKTGFKTRSILCVPVLSSHQHKTVAVIQAINKIGGPFSKADEQLLDAFCAEVGGLLDKISLQLAYDRVFADESDDQHVVSSLLTQFVTADRGSHTQKLRTSNSSRKLHSGRSTPAGLSRVPSEASLVSPVATHSGTPVSISSATEQTGTTTSTIATRRDSTSRLQGQSHAMHLMPIAPDLTGPIVSPSPLMRPWLQRVQSWEFDVLTHDDSELVHTVGAMLQAFDLLEHFDLDLRIIDDFTGSVRGRYRKNPYHNFKHAISVAHMCTVLISQIQIMGAILKPIDKLATVLAGLCHDVDHPGLTNAFESYSLSSRAILYSDQSVLEMHHAAEMFRLLKSADKKVGTAQGAEDALSLLGLPRSEFTHFRKMAIAGILATDMMHHGPMVEAARKIGTENTHEMTAKTVVELVVHSSDLCNAVLPAFRSVHKWAILVCEEFTNQVALERERGMPVTAHMDGLTSITAIAKLQCGFIDYVVAPLWNTVANLFPEVQCAGANLTRNRVLWKNIQEGLLTTEEAMKQDPPSLHSSITNTPASELATQPTSAHATSPTVETQLPGPTQATTLESARPVEPADVTGVSEPAVIVREEAFQLLAADNTTIAQSESLADDGSTEATASVVPDAAVMAEPVPDIAVMAAEPVPDIAVMAAEPVPDIAVMAAEPVLGIAVMAAVQPVPL